MTLMLTATLPTAPTIEFRAIFPGRRLTDKQSRMLLFIAQFSAVHRYPPSIRDIMQALGYTSPAPVQEMTLRLRSMGALDWQEGRARTFKVSERVQIRYVFIKYRIRLATGYYSQSEFRTSNPDQATLFNSQDEALGIVKRGRERFSIERVELDMAEDSA
jgi:SOS-response transcriptional repressor LexA